MQAKKVYIIAEAGVNHNGSLQMAFQLIDKAKEIGADCVKFQTFKAAQIVTASSPKASYQLKVTDAQESQFDMLKKLELQKELAKKWDDVNQPAPAAFYYQDVARSENTFSEITPGSAP